MLRVGACQFRARFAFGYQGHPRHRLCDLVSEKRQLVLQEVLIPAELRRTEMSYSLIPLSGITIVCSNRNGVRTGTTSAGRQMVPAALKDASKALSSSAASQTFGGLFRMKGTGRRGLTSSRSAAPPTWRCASTEEVDMEVEIIETETLERMEKTLDSVRGSFNSVRTGRASPALLDRVQVEYYGVPTGLKGLAQVTAPDGMSLLISPFDKSTLQSIEKAIQKSDLGLNPTNDGAVIRLSIPQLTQDRRKIALRNVRRDAIKAYEKLEKDKVLSEDNVKDATAGIQKLTDSFVKKVEDLQKGKEKEVTTI